LAFGSGYIFHWSNGWSCARTFNHEPMEGVSYRWDFPVKEKSRPEQIRTSLKHLVCFEFGCTLNDLIKPRGGNNITDAKMVFAYLIRKHLGDTLMKIGSELEMDHTSVISLLRRMDDIIFIKDERAKRMQRVEQLIF
jgi:chromosomal replication initiation ATPase DnaA